VSETILRVEGLTKEYVQGESKLMVLKGVSLDVQKGELLAIVGPSGAGKSTLLHIMGFLDRPTAGDVVFGEEKLSSVSPSEQASIRNQNFGFVFQMYHLIGELTALENAMMPLMVRHSIASWLPARQACVGRTREILERLGLGHRLSHIPSKLSGGEQQRLAIARALVVNPEVVFCDEPTGSLDRETAEGIRRLIVDLNKETGKTFVIVTHDQRNADLAHRQLRIEDGRIVKQ
jgi:lipoprotein-releasing system ATP-binding protein